MTARCIRDRRPGAWGALAGFALAAAMGAVIVPAALAQPEAPAAAPPAADIETAKLAKELAGRGWIVLAAKSTKGDYDLFLARPDGTGLRNITNTPRYSEFGGRFSPDGRKMLFRRTSRSYKINYDLWGTVGTLMVADADGGNPVAQGRDGQFPWASWGPDGKQIACLYKSKGVIRIHDLATKKVVKDMPRQDIFQQLYWSPDGKRLCGTADIGGGMWQTACIDIETGKQTVVSRQQNCTPDWFQKDATRLINCNRRPGLADHYGFTMLMQSTADGKSRTLLYGERDMHAYYGCTSPDDVYLILARMPKDGMAEAPLAVVRLADTPIIVDSREPYKELKSLYPNAKSGPVLHLKNLPEGFEPHWTYAKIGGE